MQADVNIVYPIDGKSYPIVDPSPGAKVSSAYITASFSTTCAGGPRNAEWGFNDETLGQAQFYDQYSAQFVWKLPGGEHRFWVKSDCGKNSVKFKVGG